MTVFAVSLGLTLVLELAYALLWGVRSRRDMLLLLAVNAVTNPPVVALYTGVSAHPAFLALLEGGAVAVEGLCYRRFGEHTGPAFLFSLCANCCSFFGGLLLNMILW